MPKTRFALTALAVASLAFAAAGCGSDSDSDSGSAGSASLAPPRSPLFVEATIQPKGELQSNVEAVASKVAGVDDLGELIVSELEESESDGDGQVDFAKDIEPWLGDKGAIFFESFDGEDFTGYGMVLPSTDTAATEAFIDKQVRESDDPLQEGSYEGVEYWVDESDETAVGLVGDSLLLGENERAFKHAVDASEGDSLADQDEFEDAVSAAVAGSFADVYVDVGTLIERSEERIDEQALLALKSAGVDPTEATAIASVVPGADQVEIEISSDLGDEEAPSGDAAELLGSLPGDAFAALAFSGFGEQLREALDEVDKEGIPGEIPPGELKSGVKELGFDLDKIAGSLEDAGLFATGSSEANIGGAFVLTTNSDEVATAIATIGAFASESGQAGIKALGGGVSGFSVLDPEELGPQPLVVASKGDRVAIGYGVKQTLRGLVANGGSTLADVPDYKAAVAALGNTPISGFVDGPGALRLADSFISSSEEDFEQAKPYLRSIRYIGIGSESDGDRAAARLIVGLKER